MVVDTVRDAIWVEALEIILVVNILDVASLEVDVGEVNIELVELIIAATTTVSERVDTTYEEEEELSRLLLSDVDTETAVDDDTNNNDVVGDDTTGTGVEVDDGSAPAPQETS